MQKTQQILPTDYAQKRKFTNWIIEQQRVKADFDNNIIFSGQAHFHFHVFLNSHNCRIWVSEDLQKIVEKKMHLKHITALWWGKFIRTFFLEDEEALKQ